MGRYLACGIAVRLIVYRNSNIEVKDIRDLQKIKNHLGKFFSLENYELDTKSEDDSFIFTIKKDFLEKNIHDTIRELSNLFHLDLSYIFDTDNDIEFEDDSFCQKNYSLKLVDDCNNIFIEGPNNDLSSMRPFYDPTWLYRRNDLFGYREKYRIIIDPSAIWIDYDKYYGEDETNMLVALNYMKNSYFKKELSKNLFFYVFG